MGLPDTTTAIPVAQLPPFDWERSAAGSSVPSPHSSSAASSVNGEKKVPVFKPHPPKSYNIPVGSMAAGTTGQTTLFEEEDNNHDMDGEADPNAVPLNPVTTADSHVVTQSVTVRNDANLPLEEPDEGGTPVKPEKSCGCCSVM